MVGDVIAGLGAFKTMFDIAKSMRDLDDKIKRNAAVSDLWEQITSMQSRYTAAIEQVDTLKKELTRFETWDAEKKRYELIDLSKGFFAYVLKKGQEEGEQPHAACTNCYARGFKSVLHLNSPKDLRDRTWFCPACKTQIRNQSSDIGELIAKARDRNALSGANFSPQLPTQKIKAPGEVCPSCGEHEYRVDRSAAHPEMGDMA